MKNRSFNLKLINLTFQNLYNKISNLINRPLKRIIIIGQRREQEGGKKGPEIKGQINPQKNQRDKNLQRRSYSRKIMNKVKLKHNNLSNKLLKEYQRDNKNLNRKEIYIKILQIKINTFRTQA
jgi:hypothetical protein